MVHVLRLKNGLAAGLVAAVIGTAAQASAGATVLGAIEDPDTGTVTTTTGYQNTTLSAPGSAPINVTAAVSCQCAVPGRGWLYSESNATGSVDISLLSNPTIHATATVGIPPAYTAEGNADVEAELDYYFEIVDKTDPTGHSEVPIVVNAAGGYTYSLDTPGYEELIQNNVRSAFYVRGIVTDYVDWDTNSDGPLAPGSQSWSDDNTYTMLTNVVYDVGLVAELEIGMSGGEGGGLQSMSVYVDPTFEVGAGADPNEYSLVFSDGVGNSPAGAAPEPSTWAMMLLGFAGLAFAGQRARVGRRFVS